MNLDIIIYIERKATKSQSRYSDSYRKTFKFFSLRPLRIFDDNKICIFVFASFAFNYIKITNLLIYIMTNTYAL